jgi:oligopeptide transport system ATP-binding protein
MVMYGGRIMEHADADHIFYHPSHPYTIGLLGALPRIDDDSEVLTSIPGNPPNLANMPAGCPFHERCTYAQAVCANTVPPLSTIDAESKTLRACHVPVSMMTQQDKEAVHV